MLYPAQMRSLAGLSILFLASLAPATALAQEVAWLAEGADCPDSREFSSLLRRERGEDARQVDVRVSAAAREDDGAWTVVITVAGQEDAQRVLRAPSCPEVASAAALYLVLVIDGVATGEQTVRVAEATEPAAEPVPSMGIGVGAAVDLGSLPAPSPGIELRYGWRGTRFGLLLTSTVFATRTAEVSSAPRFGGDFGLAVGGAGGCARALWNVWGCGGLEAGVLTASGRGTETAPSQRTLWLAGTASAVVSVPLSKRFALVGSAGVGIPLRRKDFEIAGIDRVHQASPAVLRGSLALRIGFNLTDPNRSHH